VKVKVVEGADEVCIHIQDKVRIMVVVVVIVEGRGFGISTS